MSERERIGLPPRIFLYTVDQIATMMALDRTYVKDKLLFYEKRHPGICPRDRLPAINIAPEGTAPEWRINEREFVRFLRRKGLKFYERGFES